MMSSKISRGRRGHLEGLKDADPAEEGGEEASCMI